MRSNQNRRRRLGAFAMALLLGALPLLAARTASAACQLLKTDELAVRFVGNRPLVEATINGKPVWLLVDTGAYASTLFAPAAARLGLKMYDTGDRAVGVGGEVEVMQTSIDEFALEKTKVKGFVMNVTGGVNAGGQVSRGDDREVVGVLGRNFLALIDVEFDLPNDKIRLFHTKDCGGRSLAYWSDAPGYVDMDRMGKFSPFVFPLKLNGFYVLSVLDSGASVTTVTPSIAAHAGIGENQFGGEVGRAAGIGNRTVQTRTAVFDTVDLGDEKVPHARLEVSELFRNDDGVQAGSRVASGRTEMLLGADFLHSHRVFISTSQNRIYYTYSGGPVFSKVSTDRPPPPAEPAPQAPAATPK